MARSRYEACRLLQQHEITCAIWFEDAIGHYGVPTVVFDLYLLVPDIDKAAELLRQEGWHAAPRRDTDELYHFLKGSPALKGPLRYLRLVPPDWDEEMEERTVLMPADAWNFTAEQLAQTAAGPYPPLPALLDALIDGWLDTPSGKLESHVGVQLAYVYRLVAQVKAESFAGQLKHEHCHFHYNCLVGGCDGTMPCTIPFRTHQKEIRDKFRTGKHTYLPNPEWTTLFVARISRTDE